LALPEREKQLGEALRELKELKGEAAGWARDKKALETQARHAPGSCVHGKKCAACIPYVAGHVPRHCLLSQAESACLVVIHTLMLPAPQLDKVKRQAVDAEAAARSTENQASAAARHGGCTPGATRAQQALTV
jgi:hypothetical protein